MPFSKIRELLTQTAQLKTAIFVLKMFTLFLLKQNLVEELNFQTQAKLYEISGPHHHHLICLNCDRIEEVVLKNDLAKEEKRLAKNNNFKILKHSLEFFGSCKNCCAKNNS